MRIRGLWGWDAGLQQGGGILFWEWWGGRVHWEVWRWAVWEQDPPLSNSENFFHPCIKYVCIPFEVLGIALSFVISLCINPPFLRHYFVIIIPRAHKAGGHCVGLNPREWHPPPASRHHHHHHHHAETLSARAPGLHRTFKEFIQNPLQASPFVSAKSPIPLYTFPPYISQWAQKDLYNSTPKNNCGLQNSPKLDMQISSFGDMAWTYPFMKVPNDASVILTSSNTEESPICPSISTCEGCAGRGHRYYNACHKEGWHFYVIDCIWLKDPEMSSSPASWKIYSCKEKCFSEDPNHTQLLPGPVPHLSKQTIL